MNRKAAIWGGLTIGGMVGGFVPSIWGASSLSFWGVLMSAVGSIVGIYLGFQMSE